MDGVCFGCLNFSIGSTSAILYLIFNIVIEVDLFIVSKKRTRSVPNYFVDAPILHQLDSDSPSDNSDGVRSKTMALESSTLWVDRLGDDFVRGNQLIRYLPGNRKTNSLVNKFIPKIIEIIETRLL